MNSGTLKSSTQGFQKSKNSEMTSKGVQNVLAVSSNAPTVAATSVQTSSTVRIKLFLILKQTFDVGDSVCFVH